MAELRIIIPEELKKKMEKLNVDWASITRGLIKKEVEELTELKDIISRSKLTEEDALILGRKVNKSLAKRFRDSQKMM